MPINLWTNCDKKLPLVTVPKGTLRFESLWKELRATLSLRSIMASLDPWYNQGRPQVSLLACMKRAMFLGRYIASHGGRASFP